MVSVAFIRKRRRWPWQSLLLLLAAFCVSVTLMQRFPPATVEQLSVTERRRHAETSVEGSVGNSMPKSGGNTSKLMLSSLRAVLVHEHVPKLWEGGDMRILQMMEVLAQRNVSSEITLIGRASDQQKGNPLAEEMGRMGVTPEPPESMREAALTPQGPAAAPIPEKVMNMTFDVVFMGFWSYKLGPSGEPMWTIPEMYGPIVSAANPRACRVVLSDDLQHRRFKVEMGLSEKQAARLLQRELDVYQSADAVLFISEADKNEAFRTILARDGVVRAEMRVLPFVVPSWEAFPAIQPGGKHFSPSNNTAWRITVVAGGSLSSRLSVDWLVSKVMPLVRESVVDAKLTVVGNAYARRYKGNDNVSALGFVQHLAPILRETKLFLAPSAVHSGVSTKLHLAMAHGIPAVANSASAREFATYATFPGCKSGQSPLVIADNETTFARSVASLYSDASVRSSMRACALATAEHMPGKQAQQEAISSILESCSANGKNPSREFRRRTVRQASGLDLSAQKSGALAQEVWRLEPAFRTPDIAVISIVNESEPGFAAGMVEDAVRQEVLDYYSAEMVMMACTDEVFFFLSGALSGSLLPLHYSPVRLVRAPHCDGQILADAAVEHLTSGPILALWDPKSKKSPRALLRKVNALQKDPSIGLVTSSVKAHGEDTGQMTFMMGSTPANARNFFSIGNKSLKREDFYIHPRLPFWSKRPRNVPFVTFVWRRWVHDRYGRFQDVVSFPPSMFCWPFTFWDQAMKRGLSGFHMDELGLEMFLIPRFAVPMAEEVFRSFPKAGGCVPGWN